MAMSNSQRRRAAVQQLKPDLLKALRDENARLKTSMRTAIDRCAKEVPENWLDPLLTGPQAVLKGNGGTWGCRDIEALLRGVQDRIRRLKP